MTVDDSGRLCEEPKCNSNEYVTIEGSCDRCPEHQISTDKRECNESQCKQKEIVLPDGSCELCEWHQTSDKSNRICEKI